ncbi:MAG: hypothetical protein ABI884_12865 [Gemmatimonadota bacterium]
MSARMKFSGSARRLFWPLSITLLVVDCTTKRVVEAAVPMVGGAASPR